MKQLRLGFLASHGGSNMQAIIDNINSGYLNSKASVVISNNSNSGAIERAKKEGIPCHHISSATHSGEEDPDKVIADTLENYNTDLVILAGYMKKIGPEVLRRFKGRILNIHPALLPKYGGKGMYGKYVHEAVIANGEKESGATIHIVDERYDHGRILMQMKVDVLPDDSAENLAARVLKTEHVLYSEVIKKIESGEIEI